MGLAVRVGIRRWSGRCPWLHLVSDGLELAEAVWRHEYEGEGPGKGPWKVLLDPGIWYRGEGGDALLGNVNGKVDDGMYLM